MEEPHAKESYSPFRDDSLLALILSNAVAALMAVVFEWSLHELMAVYLAQSIIIGVINFFRMVQLKEFSTKNLRMNNRPVPETQEAKMKVAVFFAFHYGFFHLVYVMFLMKERTFDDGDGAGILYLLLCIAGFAATHIYSYRHNRGRDFRHKKPNLGTLMFYPYLRIIPMHLCIVMSGAFESISLLFFLFLKTLADAGMHIVEHHLFQAPGEKKELRMED